MTMAQHRPDFQGIRRSVSTAEGRIIDHFGANGTVRSRRVGLHYPLDLDIELQWWDGYFWLTLVQTNEMSNDYATSWIRERGDHYARKAEEFESRHDVPRPPTC